jgi:hypothetical protein
MSAIVQILTGELPAHVKDAKRKKYHRDHWHAHPEYKTANAARKRERYATDEEYREQRKQQEQRRRDKMTPEQRAADNARRKERTNNLPQEEYDRRMKAKAEACKRWRARRKAEQAAGGGK